MQFTKIDFKKPALILNNYPIEMTKKYSLSLKEEAL